jgi:hypothetical protein
MIKETDNHCSEAKRMGFQAEVLDSESAIEKDPVAPPGGGFSSVVAGMPQLSAQYKNDRRFKHGLHCRVRLDQGGLKRPS